MSSTYERIIAPAGRYKNKELHPYVDGEPYLYVYGDGGYEWVGFHDWMGNFRDIDHKIGEPSGVHFSFSSIQVFWRQYGRSHRMDGPAYEVFDLSGNCIIKEYDIDGTPVKEPLEFKSAIRLYKQKVIQEAAKFIDEIGSKEMLKELLLLKPDKSDQIKVIMDMCAEFGV